ncbi:MAG TPA: fibronectin type III domain-containing protein, partial [Burkholderiaceae bacterium]|nr:fibronectin type III domain-containing protein [Burkholderiaceae bacterium]
MSIRFAADKRALRRTTDLPASFAAFTAVMYVKVVAGRPVNAAHVAYLQSTSGGHAQAVRLGGDEGKSLFATDSYGANPSAFLAELQPGAAAGQGWHAVVLRGNAASSTGMQLFHRPVGGALTSVSLPNSPGSAACEALQIGDAPFAAGDFGVPGFWADVLVAHLKVWNRALTDGEVATETAQAAPASATNLLSYHSFSSAAIGTAVVPDQGSGTFTYFNSAPDTSTDMPVFTTVPTVTSGGTLPQTNSVTAPGAPTLSTATVTGARTLAATFVGASGTVEGYRLYAQRAGGAVFVAGVAAAGATSITGSGLDPSVTYEVWVAAFNSAGEGPPSARLTRTTWKIKVRMPQLDADMAGVTG